MSYNRSRRRPMRRARARRQFSDTFVRCQVRYNRGGPETFSTYVKSREPEQNGVEVLLEFQTLRQKFPGPIA
eukprot:7836689-Pyramimonas_sp.AAC.1